MITHATDTADTATFDRIAQLARQVLAGKPLLRDEAAELTQVPHDDLHDLFYWANRIRRHFVGDEVKLCSIVAGKVGACSEDCSYCSQSRHYTTHVTPSKLTVDEMLAATDEAVAGGAGHFGIVNSGRGPTESELDWLEDYYKRTVERGHVTPCATLGELTEDQAARLVEMGVKRINHNLETSKRHFDSIISTHSYDDRVKTIRIAKQAGLSICAGGIFGLGEDWRDRLDMAFELRELGADVVPINFLNAIQGTPMHGRVDPLPPMEALQIIAVYRFILPDRDLKIAGGRDTILRDLQSWIFHAGANSVMIGNYLTTFGRPSEQDHQMLRDLGLPCTSLKEPDAAADEREPLAKLPVLQ